ncbi:MAG: O-antigen ligase family protein [Pseudarcicella sp.]|nr:O-antigen ligase family protein [Pseudarcicella sp.]MBP6410876.1 O-antigen ligase family protein [Pseudarcicella sp.]
MLLRTGFDAIFFTDKQLSWLLIFLFYIPLKQFIANSKRTFIYNFLLIILLFFSFQQAVLGLLQLWGILVSNHNLFKVTGSFHNPGPYSVYLACFLPLSVQLILEKKTQTLSQQILYYTAYSSAIATVLILPVTESRSAWLGALLGTSWVLCIHFQVFVFLKGVFSNAFYKLIAIVIVLFLSLGAIYFLYNFKKASAFGRLVNWKIEANMFIDAPFFGHGVNSFQRKFGHYQAQYFAQHRLPDEIMVAGKTEYAFNDFFQIALEYGFIGLVLYLLMLFYVFKNAKTTSLFLGGIIAFLISSFTSYPMECLPILLLFMVFMAFEDAQRADLKSLKRFKPNIRLCVSVLLASLVFLCFYNYQSLRFYSLVQKGMVAFQDEDHEATIHHLSKAYPIRQNDANMLLHFAKSKAILNDNVSALKLYQQSLPLAAEQYQYTNMGLCYQALKQNDLAEKSFKYATCLNPNFMYPHFLLMKLYLSVNNKQKAKNEAQTILQMPVKVVSEATNEMQKEAKGVM